jgi:alpha-1,6-mannosyltransferase
VTRRRADWPLWMLGAVLLALTAWGAFVVDHFDDRNAGYFTLVHAAFYALAAWIVVARPPDRPGRSLVIILGFGLAMRLLLLPGAPLSTDVFRYIWDGRVQGAGINPYLYLPVDEALSSLRDDVIYPNINRADYAPTIYPPVAQIAFFLITRVSESVTFMKAAMVGCEAVAVWAIVKLLVARGQPVTHVLLYAWHPLPLWEFARSGHVDALAIACLMLAFLAAERRAAIWAGVALAAGTLVKYSPAIVGPALYRRWDWRLPAGFLVAAAVLYLPYVSAGPKIIGFLPHYFVEEGLNDGPGFFIWIALDALVHLPSAAIVVYLAAAGAIMAVLALAVLMRERKETPDLFGAMVLITVFLVLLSPHYAWYFAWLVPFLCFYPSLAIIYLTSAINWIYIGHGSQWLFGGSFVYGGFAVILAAEFFVRRWHRKEAQRGDIVTA